MDDRIDETEDINSDIDVVLPHTGNQWRSARSDVNIGHDEYSSGRSSISYVKRFSSLSFGKTCNSGKSSSMLNSLSQSSLNSNFTSISIPFNNLPVTNGIVDIQRSESPPSYSENAAP